MQSNVQIMSIVYYIPGGCFICQLMKSLAYYHGLLALPSLKTTPEIPVIQRCRPFYVMVY